MKQVRLVIEPHISTRQRVCIVCGKKARAGVVIQGRKQGRFTAGQFVCMGCKEGAPNCDENEPIKKSKIDRRPI